MYAAAMGLAGVRAYAFDGMWQTHREQAHIDQTDLQTGASPFGAGTDRWSAMVSSYNLVKSLEPELLQPRMHAIDLGPSFVTGARQGPNSRMLIAVNFSEGSESPRVDLRPYRYPGNLPITRYRLVGANLSVDTLPSAASDSVSFAPGEAVVWLFRPAQANVDRTPPSISLSAPLPEATVAGQVELSAVASDAGGVARVEFLVDGRVLSTATAAPYKFTWDSTSFKAGIWHSVAAIAYDPSGNSSQARTMLRTVPSELKPGS
jgi:hypothetical protein